MKIIANFFRRLEKFSKYQALAFDSMSKTK